MIITLTHNPAVDQTAWVDQLQPGTIHRVQETHIDPAGKGINVSRIAHRLGWPTITFGFLAGETGNLVEKALQDGRRLRSGFWRAKPATSSRKRFKTKECSTISSAFPVERASI